MRFCPTKILRLSDNDFEIIISLLVISFLIFDPIINLLKSLKLYPLLTPLKMTVSNELSTEIKVGFSIVFSISIPFKVFFISLLIDSKLFIFSEAIPRELFSYVDITKSGLRL